MSKIDQNLFNHINQRLERFDREVYELPGLADLENRECLVLQIIDSIRRVEYSIIVNQRKLSGHCADATLTGFNPIMAASWHFRNGNINEAVWIIFLLTYFGKSKKSGWALIRAFYSALNTSPAYWTWERVSNNFGDMIEWLKLNSEQVKSQGVFSNHRRYTSFNPNSSMGPISVFSTYFNWIGNEGNHELKLQSIINQAEELNQPIFRVFYNSIPHGMSLARLGKFDFLTMISKIGIINMVADSTYMVGATGPISGAKLLFWGSNKIKVPISEIQNRMDSLANFFNFEHRMQIIEDSVCNWQKSPGLYNRFTG